MKDTKQTAVFARMKLVQLIMGYGTTQAIACVAKLGIADYLADGPRTIDHLSQATSTSPPHLYRLMRALCRVGLFSESDVGFHLTPMSEHLRKDAADSLLPLADFHGDEMYLAFGKLSHNVRTGVPAWDSSFGMSVWDYFRERPERGALFDETMRLNHVDDVHDIVLAYDFSGVRTVADVGGGEGSLLRAILGRHASIHGVLVDLAEVVSRTSVSEVWRELASRCTFVEGNFFNELPRGIDLYILRHVLHDWNDDNCMRLLKQCRTSMDMSSRLLVIEGLVNSPTLRTVTGSPDIGMMVFGGEERTTDGYENLLVAAGLTLTRVIPCAGVALLEARPA